jgi:hypothetical protein
LRISIDVFFQFSSTLYNDHLFILTNISCAPFGVSSIPFPLIHLYPSRVADISQQDLQSFGMPQLERQVLYVPFDAQDSLVTTCVRSGVLFPKEQNDSLIGIPPMKLVSEADPMPCSGMLMPLMDPNSVGFFPTHQCHLLACERP